ncbi:hypothetical protein RV18_GL001552 [Enterococcus termitis]|nr:hypothetical protein RV18_GL001552 [Enterococcus termitis]
MLKRTPKFKEFQYARTAATTFKSWNNFLKMAGFEEIRKWEKMDFEETRIEVLNLAEKLGHTPTQHEFGYSKAQAIANKYGGWNNFLVSCGLKPTLISHTKESLLRDVRLQAKGLARTPSISEFPYGGSVRNYFDSWDSFVEEAGLEKYQKKCAISEDDLIREIRQLANKLQRVPKTSEFKRYGVAKKRFNTWQNFLIAAGLETPDNKCLICGKPVKRNGSDYCSRKCYAKSKQNTRNCVVCGKEFDVPPSSQKICCSKECSTVNRKKLHAEGTYDKANEKWFAKKEEYYSDHKGENHPNAKSWIIKSPRGKVYEITNLKNFITLNLYLFEGSTVRQVLDGFIKIKASELGKRKRPVHSYKGWTLISWSD